MKPTAKLGSLVLAALMVVTFLLPMPIALAATDYSVITVKLTSMGSPTSVAFQVKGAYQIAEATGVVLVSGVNYTISVKDSGLLLAYNNGAETVNVTLPATVTFKQYANGTSAYNMLYVNNPGYGWRNYTGDMTFTRPSGGATIQLQNKLYIEEYLYGVIAYEMSSAFPLEALKSQAVCARTYAMRYTKAGSMIGDTSANQVYKGLPLNSDGSLQSSVVNAVDGTKGQVIVTGDPANMSLVDGMYSASNGGQIYTLKMRYGNDSTNTYHVFKNDPYDLANTASPAFVYVIPAQGDNEAFTGTNYNDTTSRNKAALMLSLIKDKCVAALAGQGINVSKDAIRVNAIKSAAPAVRRDYMPEGCNAYTQIAVNCNVTATAPTTAPAGTQWTTSAVNLLSAADSNSAPMTDGNGQTVTIPANGAVIVTAEAGNYVAVTYNSISGYLAKASLTTTNPAGATQVVYNNDLPVALTYLSKGSGSYDANSDSNSIYSVYGELKTAFSSYNSLINTSNMWLLYAEPTGDGRFLNVVARGYGHGIGLSQRGAQQMGAQGKSYMDILNFYYSTDITTAKVYAVAVTRPALAQMPGRGDDRTVYGTIKVSSGNVNLRASASTSAKIVAAMPKGAQVQILGTSGTWYQVRYVAKNLTGYVMQSYVTLTAPTATPTPTAAPTPTARPTVANGTVNATPSTGTGQINIYTAAATDSTVIVAVPAGAPVVIYNLSPASGWYEIGYIGDAGDLSAGFAQSQDITVTAQPTATPAPTVAPTAAPDYSAKAVIAGISAATSLRAKASSSGKVVVKIPKGATVTVLSVPSTSWLQVSYNGKTGYLPATSCYVGGSSKYRAGIILSAPQGLYRTAGDLTSLLAMVPVNTTVQAVGTVKAGGRTWYKVVLNSGYAFVYAPKVRLASSKSALPTVSAASTTTTNTSPAPSSTNDATAGAGSLAAKPNVSSYLTLRATASTSGASLTRIPKGATMTINAVVNATWLQVTYDGKTGYVQSKYALIGGKTAYKACQVTTSSLLVRSAAGSSTSIGSLSNGSVVCFTAKTTKNGVVWYKILYGSGSGYISSQYCRLAS